MTKIYTLSHPLTKDVVYVGQTSLPIKTRLYGHIHQSNNPKIKSWVLNLKTSGLKPLIELVEEGEKVGVDEEVFWINQFKSWGFCLFNITHNTLLKQSNRMTTVMAKNRPGIEGHKISWSYINLIRRNKPCQHRMSIEMKVHIDTVERWLKMNLINGKLTTFLAVKIITEELNVSENELLEKTK